jgi:hypothetical protein
MQKPLKLLFFILASAICVAEHSAYAQTTINETFMNAADIHESQMVWNLSLGELHPPLLIAGWDSGSGATNTSYSVGDGHDGDFILSTYALFSVGGSLAGNVITVDTDVFTELDFTSFDLVSGWTLRPTGSHPLVIRSQSDVIIDGTIDCSGYSGGNATTDSTAVIAGGFGICGGGAGGASVADGATPTSANAGVAGGPNVTGGAGGGLGSTSGGQGGGGGGAYIKPFAVAGDKPDPTAGVNPVGGAGGAAGSVFQDDAFTVNLAGAGSGGGGGSASPGTSSGGSGGGGGGNIQIYAVRNVTVTTNGSVLANGGNGGNAIGLLGGGGGGGGAGSILIFAGAVISLNGPVTAIEGGGSFTDGGAGGNGAYGRTWIVDSTGSDSGTVTELPTSNLVSRGQAEYETGVTYSIVSNAIDLGSSLPTITGLPITVVNQAGSTITYALSFSSQTDLSGFPAYALSLTYLNMQVERYVSFKLEVENTNATAPVTITGLSFELNNFNQTQFQFSTGCGGSNTAAPPPTSIVRDAAIGFLVLPLVFLSLLRFSPQRKRRK